MNYAREQKDKGESFKKTNAVKFIRNDSAALLPSLAEQIEEFMKATVLPAYSMTESSPISSNPRFGERKLKSVGPTVGPDLVLKQGYPDETDIPDGSEGEVCVRGACVMKEARADQLGEAPRAEAAHRPKGGT